MNIESVKYKMAAHTADEKVYEKPVFDSPSADSAESKPKVRKVKKDDSNGSSASSDAPAEEEKPVDKNSWEYKAKEQVKLNKENGKQQDYVVRKNADSLFGTVKKDIPKFDIKDINYGEKDVTFEGRLLLTEDLRLAKSGKCVIANFIILDKTGGISGMMFVKPNEADAFEKKFKKGGYAGFQGTVENNRGEIAVKVSGIYEADPPKGRKEVCDYKRVELHAHTKFSDMDGVIDPGELVKTAFKWGHRGIALTDHGVVQAFPVAFHALNPKDFRHVRSLQ